MRDRSLSPTLALAMELLARPSVTPNDGGCQALLGQRLDAIGFQLQPMRFGNVDNLWARRGENGPLFVFAGHTDVVPTGPVGAWQSPPFQPSVRDGKLYGRGAADMKSSLAAMVCACEAFVHANPDHPGSIGLLLTSDEEGPAVNGTVKVVDTLWDRGERIDWCLVGEPSSNRTLADTVKIGRRGSLSGKLTVRGVQGHVAYPHLADNPIHRFAPALHKLVNTVWDHGNEHFPPTSFQISNLHAGTGAGNVIPGDLSVDFNLRYSTASDHETIKSRVGDLLDGEGLNYVLEWSHSGRPFLTRPGRLIEAVKKAISREIGIATKLATGGGTSDGRFLAPTGAEVVELGPSNATIHQVDECVETSEIEGLTRLYTRILVELLTTQTG